jgi:hypothetical protein
MEHDAGIDVSLECSSVCVVDGNGKIVRETKVASEPAVAVSLVLESLLAPKRNYHQNFVRPLTQRCTCVDREGRS